MSAVDRVAERLRRLPGVDETRSRFNRELRAFRVDGREFAHVHGDDLEIRLTRKLIERLDDERVYQRSRNSDWICVPAHLEQFALDLARQAVDANRRR